MTTYRIRNWDEHFENNRTRDMKDMRWVPVPNKHDGEGYAYIMSLKDGISIYGAWHLILQVASKCKERGTLLRDDGTPLLAKSIAIKSRGDEKTIQRALEICCSPEVDWIEALTEEPQEGAEIPQEPARKGREWNGIEGREENGMESVRSAMGRQDVIEAWNAIAEPNKIPKLVSMTDSRWDHYKARLKDYKAFSEEEFWGIVKTEVDQMDDFPRGKNDRGWYLTFDYLIAPRGAKLIEGHWRRKEEAPKRDMTSLLG